MWTMQLTERSAHILLLKRSMVFPFFVLLFVCKLLYYYYFSNCGLWSSWLTLCLFLVHVIALLCFALYISLFLFICCLHILSFYVLSIFCLFLSFLLTYLSLSLFLSSTISLAMHFCWNNLHCLTIIDTISKQQSDRR